jgi:hypothetical protein
MSAAPVFRRILLYGGVLAVLIAVVGGTIGYLTFGGVGLVSALIGTAMAVVFMVITVVSILLATRLAGTPPSLGVFFGIVMGGWVLKFVVFLVLVFVLKDQPWINPIVLFLSIVAGVVGSLVVDLVVIAKSRMPYVSDVRLPPAPHDEV